MIVTVTMNPCIDQTLVIDNFTYGGLNKVLSARRDAAGKGLNVSLALSEWGIASTAASFAFAEGGGIIGQALRKAGVEAILPKTEGRLRTNTKLFNRAGCVMTELNERGADVSAAALCEMREAICRAAKGATVLALCGSLPPNVPDTFYREIMTATARSGLRQIVDTDGALRLALEANPYLIKPNAFELEQLLGRTLPTREAILLGAREAIGLGASLCCVSLGADGAMLVSKDEAYFASALPVNIKSAQGAGDSMVAGFIRAMREGCGLPDMLRYAVAAASATILHEGTQPGASDDFEQFCGAIDVEVI